MKRINSPPPIAVRKLRKVFRQTTTGQNVVAIDRLDLDIAPREVVAIVGQTGCGKSTLFDLMIGLERPSEGSSCRPPGLQSEWRLHGPGPGSSPMRRLKGPAAQPVRGW